MKSQVVFDRWVKKQAHMAEIREALKRWRDGVDKPLPGDDELILEGGRRDAKLWTARHLREERKYEKLPREQRVRYDVSKGLFYREQHDAVTDDDGTRRREWRRNYIESSTAPEYMHAITTAVSEEEELQRIKDFLDEEPDPIKAAMSALGAIGGKVKSVAKARAARRNGKLGGRPRKATR
jgi:hypothetical protein